jgi:adenine-specific DNA-methyltransferase
MSLVSFAHESGVTATNALVREDQKLMGQYMTPPAIARTMARRACARLPFKETLRILEPAAGTGILVAAALEEILSKDELPKQIFIHMFELDERLERPLTLLAARMRREGARFGVVVRVSITIADFLLSDASNDRPQFDLVISNPPYFKLNKKDARSIRHSYAVYGQPNIYGLFMAACARVLNASGRWCFITPRSWTNGPYFGLARRKILLHLDIEAMHVFGSRRDHFAEDEILQEAMITWATAQVGNSGTITLSISSGISDLDRSPLEAIPAREVIRDDDLSTISIPTLGDLEDHQRFRNTLADYGFKASTGPVVAFRAAQYLHQRENTKTVPLIWMQHVQHMRICWPINKKREHITANAETAWMLLPNQNMVVLRRFSPKEDIRRITAAPYIAGSISGDVIGLENHTNYIYRPGGTLSRYEAIGLAAFLNSPYADTYLRRVSGNTQVNAADLRNFPLPVLSDLVKIGRALQTFSTLRQADYAVDQVLGQSPEALIA